tara:strand:- start:1687 stop:2079 length:393 start_codon:yes stop_codon:yes gene_type:complete
MPFIYCTECGYKNVFTTRQAKFCAGCGQSLVEEEITKRSKYVPTPTHLQSAQANKQRDSHVEGVPNIEKLEYTVDSVSENPTIGDLINTKKEKSGRPKREIKGASKALSPEEVEAESLRECASSINHSTD